MTAMEQMREMGVDPMADLKDLGYEMSADGHLIKVGGCGGFEFQGNEHYDQLADAVSEYVGMLLEEGEAGLQPLWLPLGSSAGEGAPIFVSRDFDVTSRLLMLVQGRGRIRAGVWACSLCINHGLDEGSMIPYIHKAAEAGYGIVVLNPNATTDTGGRVPGSETPERHLAYVWEQVLAARCQSRVTVDVVAHSEGGRAFVALLGGLGRGRFLSDAGLDSQRNSCDRSGVNCKVEVGRIAFVDSYHTSRQLRKLPCPMQDLLADPQRTVNYVPHDSAVGTPVDEWGSQDYWMNSEEKGCVCLASGVCDHSAAVNAALEAVFAFLVSGWHADVKAAELETVVRPGSATQAHRGSATASSWVTRHVARPGISLSHLHVPHFHMPHLRIPNFVRLRRRTESHEVDGFGIGDRVEAEYEGHWHPATVVRVPPDQDGEQRWTVQCDGDEAGLLTYTHEVRGALQ